MENVEITYKFRKELDKYILENNLDKDQFKFQKVFKFIRQYFGLNQYQFADLIKMDQYRVYRFEKLDNKRKIRLETIKTVVKSFQEINLPVKLIDFISFNMK